MKELIKIGRSTRTGNPIVNARDLHAFLEVGKEFANWMKDRIKKYGFVENQDYARLFYDVNGNLIRLAKNGKHASKGIPRIQRIEYALTLDCAKELSMVQNNEKGRVARQYFIEKEKEYWVLRTELEKKPEMLYNMTEVAGILALVDYYGKVGRNALYNILYFQKIVDAKNRPLQKYVDKGYFTKYPTRVTEDGLEWLKRRFDRGQSQEVLKLERKVDKLMKRLDSQEENQALMLNGVSSIVETLYFNKGGKKTEEQNRVAIKHLQSYLESAGRLPKALN